MACHTNIRRSTGSEAVAPLIIGFSIATYHYHDAEIGGPLKGTLERYIQEGTFLLHKNGLPTEISNRLSALADLAPRFFAEQDYGRPRHQLLQPQRCNGMGGGVRSNLRSGVEQQNFAHCVSPLGETALIS